MRGVSAIIELLLITLLLISLVSLLWLFTSGTINVITRSSTNQTQRTQEIFSTCMIVDSIKGNTVYLKNCGYGVIVNDSLGVYLDDMSLRYTMTPQKIGRGEVGTININASDMMGVRIGDHDLKITNPNAQTTQRVEAVLPSSCVMDLEFNEGSGNVVNDYSGNGNNGVLGDGTCSPGSGTCPNWVDGKFGYALKFDGLNDFVSVASSDSLNSPNNTNKITVEGWIKPYNVAAGSKIYTIAQKGSGEHQGFWLAPNMNMPGIGIWWEIGDGSGSFLNCNYFLGFSEGVWYHIVGTYDGSTMRLYLNGNLVSQCTQNVIMFFDNANLSIGRGVYGVLANATIDSVRIYNQALTPDQMGIFLNMK